MTKPAAIAALVLFAAVSLHGKLTPDQQQKLPPPAQGPIAFARDIKPILEASCVKCHGRGKEKGGFKLDTRVTLLKGGDSGPAVIAGRSAESTLIELVSGLDPDNVMPVKGSKLTPAQVGLLRAWIDQGLPWDEGITFAKPPSLNLHPRSPEAPTARAGLTHPIDRWMASYFDQHHLKPAAPVEDRVFARRAYLDVIGLVPSPKELEAFLADRARDKRERLVSRLLADQRRYADHWLTFWNDLLRNDYRGTGYIDGGRRQISTWLYATLYTNMPYDRFVADLIHPETNSSGFTMGIVWRGTVNASQLPPMQAAQNISQVFMGVNLKCASCHDSFINDWALSDAYALANVYADGSLEIFQCDKPTGKKAGVAFLYPELGLIPAQADKAERTRRLAEIMTQKANGRLSRTIVNRLWAKFLGRGLIEPTDDMEQVAWHQDLLDWLANDLVEHGYDLKHTMKVILTSRAYQMPAVSLDEQKRADYVFTGPAVRRLSAEQFRDAIGSLTGVWYSEPASGLRFKAADEPEAQPPALPASAHWIWSQPDAASRAPAERIYFHKTLVLDRVPSSAWGAAAADNSYTLYVNGTKVAAGSDWNEPDLVNLKPHLKRGTNLLAVAAVNHTPENKPPAADQPARAEDANPAGFIFFAQLVTGKETIPVATDNSWTWSRTKTDGWEKPVAQLTDAQPAAELGGPTMAPWNAGTRLAQTLSLSRLHTDVRASLVAADPLMIALGRPNR
ncbi:MAG TPA: DUF1549 domain-containing protein, partial [Candidatus Saccharimonadales bacterium]|nr:DUF1549 domain-containing protein [Candidatus Saccharimonadales bacterium]